MPNLDAIIFIPALAGSVVFGFVFLLFASHYYLSVMQSAGAGARDVAWVNEPILDHFWKVFYLAWLMGLWFGPAYFVGRAIGHRPLAPVISPKKTVEGFLGGYIAGFAVVVGLNYIMDLGVPAAQIVLLALLLPPVATVGDLAESAVKRAVGIKDASELIPGHGGFLDRLDSILFVFAAVYFFTQTVVY